MSDKQELSDLDLMDLVHTPDAIDFGLDPELAVKLTSFLRAAKSVNTIRAYKAAWSSFTCWCSARSYESLPARPEVVAAYLADATTHLKVSTLGLHVAAVRHGHEIASLPSPTKSVEVATVMQGIRRALGRPAIKKKPLLVGDVRAIVERLGVGADGIRDRALLLLGFCGGFRRSELVALDVEDIDFKPEGMVVMIRRSKTDGEGRGRTIGIGYGTSPETCPVTAIRRWLTLSSVETGPLLRAVDRHGRVRDRRLTDRSVARIVQRLGVTVGLDKSKLGGHSLRSGFATSAAAAGIEERSISRTTGHRSIAVLRGYIQDGTVFEGKLVTRLGL